MKHLLAATAATALLSMAACGTDVPPPPNYCPNVAVLQQASMLTTYLPGQTDIGGQITTAKITGVAGSCTLIKKNTLLRVKMLAGFTATNGPANQGKPVILPYFVSISQGDHIISKTDYSIELDFDGNTTTASGTSKPVTIEMSSVPASASTDVLVGFQLTPQQLAAAANTP